MQSDRGNGIHLSALKATISAKRILHWEKAIIGSATNGSIATRNCITITGFNGAKQAQSHKQAFELHGNKLPVLAGNDEAPNPVEHLLMRRWKQ